MGGKRVPLVQGVNDLATLRPDLLDDWDWDENNVNPDVLQLSSTSTQDIKRQENGYRKVSIV